jgi:hypothetical protein
MMGPALIWLDEDGPSDNPWVAAAIFGSILLVLVLSIVAYVKKRRRIERWLAGLGFTKQAYLPEGLKAPQSVWQAPPQTRRIFVASYAGFACVLFEIDQGVGESSKWVSAVAVERSSGGPLLADAVNRLGAALDQASTPGWLVAMVPRASAEQAALEPLLQLLTRESWSGLVD